MIKHWGLALLVAAILTKVHGQEYDTPNSSPHGYPGQPQGDFSPEWQKCELHPNYSHWISSTNNLFQISR